ncbi:MAG: NERD domain-containing protein/DEAD/DEAH box helicase [Gammaproteobacteria bacterium]|nr:MAG: NERD domain-containing protein/DEAD/DEAH box helicase [Gammaproteobacteria bacterium]
MATFLSSPGAGNPATPGERRFAERLRGLLEDDYLCWFNVPVGAQHRHPDFLVLHPGRGLLVLEVKDWRLETIRDADPVRFTIDTGSGHKVVPSPLEQARQYAHAVVDLLRRDPQLVEPPGSAFEGRLNFPYGYGVVLTNITRHQFESSGLEDILQSHLVICKDEMTEAADPEAFQSRLWAMFNVHFESRLTMPQVERVRWHLFPELRIHQPALDLTGTRPDSGSTRAADLLQVMDLAQEEIARSIGEGHRVIHGVAGSGKTLILAYRCLHLARTLHKPILVLVFNRSLASWLRHHLALQGVGEQVTVHTFHAWCAEQLRLYHVSGASDGSYDELVRTVIRAVDRGQIPRAQYGALMIDEGHDFAPEWLQLAVQMLDPESNSLLLLYDDAQSIYGANRPRSFSFRSVGIAATGRTKILRRNYRNTDEILACARSFAAQLLSPVDADDDGVPLISPESGGRTGVPPRFAQLASLKAEADYIGKQLLAFHTRGISWSEIGVLYTAPFVADELASAMSRISVPFDWLRDAKTKSFDPTRVSVKLMTPHSSKGLQFRVVLIAGLGFWPFRAEADEARLLYVGMTRATHELVMTSCKASAFSERVRTWCERAAA